MPPKRTSSAKKSISAAREAASPRPSRASSKAGRSPSANNGRSLNGRASANGVNATSPRAPPRTRSKTPTLPPPVKRKSQSLSVSRSKSTSVLSVAEKVVDAFLNAATPLSTVKSKGRGRGKKITLPDDGELDEAQQDQLRQQVAERGVMTMADHLHAAVDGSTENQDPPTEGQKAVTVPTHNEYIAAKSNSVPIMPEDGSLPLYHFDEVPVWMQHNPFILTSYRAHYSLGMCMRSLFRIHTETANVWTHLLGLLFFISFMAYGFVNIIKPEPTHIIIFVLFSLGCCLCMGCSACFHLFSAHHCERVFSRMIMMDYFV